MKKKTLLAPLFLLGITISAQVGINTEVPQSTLDVRSKIANATTGIATVVSPDDGVLVPRVASFGSINGTTDGQLVYLTANVTGTGTVANPQYKKGFHYWNAPNTTWTPIDTDTSGAGSSPQDLRLVGTSSHITIDAGNGGTGTTVTGAENIAIGKGALNADADAASLNNIAIGSGALSGGLSFASNNIGIGKNVMIANSIVSSNVGIGNNTLPTLSDGGGFNVAIGDAAGSGFLSGERNTFLGASSRTSAEISGATAIGYNSRIGVANGIALGATGVNTLVGIDTDTPTQRLDVASGNVRIRTIFGFAGDPTVDKVVVTDNMGVLKTIAPVALNNNDWHITGNAGTNSTLNFIGTTDNQDFVVKRNNVFSGLIGTENTSWGNNSLNTTGTGVSNTAIGALVLKSNTVGFGNTGVGYNAITANTTGNNNTALGINTLQANTIGENNTAVGPYALQANTTGDDNTAVGAALTNNTTARVNTAVGASALGSTTTGGANTAVGGSSLSANISGIANTAVGTSALNVNTAGNNNTAVGQNSLPSSTGSNNIGIGRQAGRLFDTGSFGLFLGDSAGVLVGTGAITNATAIGKNATVGANNSMVLGGTGVDAVNVGIGVNVPTNTLHVRPSLLTLDPMRVEGVKSSTVNTDKVMVVDNNGVVKTAISSQSAFAGYLLVDNIITTTAMLKIVVNNEAYDQANEYNSTTGDFTPVASGLYEYEMKGHYTQSASSVFSIGIVDNTTGLLISKDDVSSNSFRFFIAKGFVNLTAGQTYYFGARSMSPPTPAGATVSLIANPSNVLGTGIGTYFSLKRVQ